jgi:hypothetical protein
MNIHKDINRPYWVVITQDKVHFGVLEQEQEVSSSNEILTFATEQEWKSKLTELNVNYEEEII